MAKAVSFVTDTCFFSDFLLPTVLPADWNSALMIILNGQKKEHLDMLDGGIIQRLLEEKWKTFAQVVSYCVFMFATYIFHV